MASAHLSTKVIARLGREIYDREIRKKVEKKHHGKFLVIEVDSHDYEIDEDAVAANERLRQRHPDSLFYMLRIGHRGAFKLGTRFRLPRR
jgi:hypothetical protein